MTNTCMLANEDIPENKEYLISNYLQDVKNNRYLLNVFMKIISTIEGFTLKNGKINNLKFDKEQNCYIYTLMYKDPLGIERSHIVIKQLRHYDVYEIRINEQFEKHRILFFNSKHIENHSILSEFIILSFGFTKGNKYKNQCFADQLTNKLSKSSEDIKILMDSNNNKSCLNSWLGDDWDAT